MIEFFIIENDSKVLPSFRTTNKEDKGIPYEPCVDSLWRQGKELNIKLEIKKVRLTDVPTKTDSLLVGILCENNIIPSDYLGRVLACNNLYRSASGFIGDHTPLLKQPVSMSELYHKRRQESFLGHILMQHVLEMTPLIYGAIFNGHYYNSNGGFVANRTPRTFSLLHKIVGRDLIWSKRLSIFEYVPHTNDLNEWFYDLGYFFKRQHTEDIDFITTKEPETAFCHAYDMGYYEAKMDEAKLIKV